MSWRNIAASVILFSSAFAAPTPAQAAQPSGGKLLYLRDEAKCVSQQTPPAEYPLPDALPNCNTPQTLVVAAADGRIMREVRLPARVTSYAFSPDGAWMAYHTGEVSGCEKDEPTKTDLALNLLNIQTGETKLVTKLLRGDFPQNILELKQYDEFSIGYDGFPINLCWTFTDGIRKMAWSSDSQHLAFAGEMDGPSSDLYVLDMPTLVIRRLSDGIENIRAIEWSPDNKWIMHASLLVEGAWRGWNLHFAAADGSAMKSPSKMASFLGWLDKDNYLEGICSTIGCIITRINLVSGKQIRVSRPKDGVENSSYILAYDPKTHLMVFGSGFQGDLSLVNGLTLKSNPIKDCSPSIESIDSSIGKSHWAGGCRGGSFVGKGNIRMVIWGDQDKPIKTVSINGLISELPAIIGLPSTNSYSYQPPLDGISPDGKYIVIPKADGLYVYRLSDGLFTRFIKMELLQLPIKDDYKAGTKFLWVSQNTTFVKVTMPGEVTSQLYALDFLRGQPKLVDEGVISGEMVVGGR